MNDKIEPSKLTFKNTGVGFRSPVRLISDENKYRGIAGLNYTDESVGYKLGGINISFIKTVGAETSLLANFTKDIDGSQFTLGLNYAKTVHGNQTGLIANYATEAVGNQKSFVGNRAGKITGNQRSLVYNIADELTGSQGVSVLCHVTSWLEGLQCGLVCYANKGNYLQLGILTIRGDAVPWHRRVSPFIGWHKEAPDELRMIHLKNEQIVTPFSAHSDAGRPVKE